MRTKARSTMPIFRKKLERVLLDAGQESAQGSRFEFKNVFGAVAAYVDGNIFITCGKFGTALKLPPDIVSPLLLEPEVKPLKYFPKGRSKKGYAVLPERILADSRRMESLIEESIRYVSKG